MQTASSAICRLILVFSLSLLSLTAIAADWDATGGTVVDAAWPGDTPALVGDTNVGELAGEGGVSGGSATYSIPINVVPGRAGMQPNVSLNYSSSGGNGIAGVGWSLSAGGAISRCGKTMAQDGVTDKVHFDRNKDRLCLNGQRLVAVSGTYGLAGAEYRTEVDSFVKVVQSGGHMDQLTTYFTAYYANGTKETFGNSGTTRHSLEGIDETLSWVLSKTEDVSSNNTIEYNYTNHGDGEYTLASIDYTGEQSVAGDRHVAFEYEARTDVRNGFQSGGLWVSTKRLKSITTKYQGTDVRKYKLTYEYSLSSGNSLLKTATECGYESSQEYCLPTTLFEWYEGAPEYKLQRLHYTDGGQTVYIGESSTIGAVLPKKDMNGDGTLDWHTVFLNSEGEAKADNTFPNFSPCQIVIYTGTSRCFNADFNQDGLTDSWDLSGTGSTRTFRYGYANYNGNAPTMVNTPITLNLYANGSEEILGISDLNGDGLSDVLVRRGIVGSGTGTAKVEVFLHTGNHSAPFLSTGHFVYSIPARYSTGSVMWQLDEDVQIVDDFDGNGIEDVFVFVKNAATEYNASHTPQWHKPKFHKVLLSESSSGTYSSTTHTYGNGTRVAFPNSVPNYVDHELLADLNGDGLLDLLGAPSGLTLQYKINLGDGQLSDWVLLGNGSTMYSKLKKGTVPVVLSPTTGGGGFPGLPNSFDEPRLVTPYVLDHDQNGLSELLVPYTRVVSFCYDHMVQQSGGQWVNQTHCDDDMYRVGESGTGTVLPDINDRSVWEYHKAEFSVTGYTTAKVPIISVTLVPTSLVAMITQGATADIYGNGHQDFLTMINCTTSGTNCSYGDANGNNDLSDYTDSTGASLVTGPYMNRNVGSFGPGASTNHDYEVVDRLKNVETALGNRVEWKYLPLNTGKGASDYYTVDQSHLGATDGYLHFSANISVVSELKQSNGLGGLNTYNYKYRDATLNSQGRGFQGFEQIVVDDVANDLRSVSDYHVQFPLAGDLVEVRRCLLDASDLDCSVSPINTTVYEWDLWRDGVQKVTVVDDTTNYQSHVLDNTASENRYWVSPHKESSNQYSTISSQTAGVGALQPITMPVSSTLLYTNSTESTFNANGCSTNVVNTYEEPTNANVNKTTTATVYVAADTVNWWLCRTDYTTTTTEAVTGRGSDYAAIDVLSDFQKQVKATYTWNTTHRKPATITTDATIGGGKSTCTTNTYDPTYGLPLSVKIQGTHHDSTASCDMWIRETNWTYTSDNYFVATETNDLGHVTTSVTDPEFGQVTSVTDPNGQVATSTFDHFGRQASVKAPGEPTVRSAYYWCSGFHGGTETCPSGENAQFLTKTEAVGSPDGVTYFDQFGREVYTKLRNFADTGWNISRRRHDDRGNVLWESNVYGEGLPADERLTYFDGYDNLGRLTRVRKPQADGTHSQTDYDFDGLVVDITVQSFGSSPKTLYMERKLNGLSQLVYTQDANGSYTRYAYDGGGNLISLEDADNNKITTQFNALGQKAWVHDPNGGNSEFSYNSLGEVERQKTANNVILTFTHDTLGRVTERKTGSDVSGMWVYDGALPDGRKGMLDYESDGDSLDTTKLIKSYRYGTTSSGKVYLQETQHDIYEGSGLPSHSEVTEYFVDSNFGRPLGIKYGSTSLTIVYEYSSLGYMTHTKNASSGYTYRQVTSLDALGNITGSALGVSGSAAMGQSQGFDPATGQMKWNLVTKNSDGSIVHELDYLYEGFSNLDTATVTAFNSNTNSEEYVYDLLHRLTSSTRTINSVQQLPLIYAYSNTGNITQKSDYFSDACYGTETGCPSGGNAGPNAIRELTYAGGGTTLFSYDSAGNMLSGDGRTISYNAFNKPTAITMSGVTSSIRYGADVQRYWHSKSGLPGGGQVAFNIDKHLEIESQGTRITYRHYFDGVAVLNKTVDTSGTDWVLGFNLKDRLGGVVTLADHNGVVLEHRSYDPFGKPRQGDFSDASGGTIQSAIAEDSHQEYSSDPITDRGFTDHEHLDEQRIIHMNGRVYSYDIGRFTSVDPFIQDPTSSQSLNPYSYIFNNPLVGTDPSGYIPEHMNSPRHDDELPGPRGNRGWKGCYESFHCTPPPGPGGKHFGADSEGNGATGGTVEANQKDGAVVRDDEPPQDSPEASSGTGFSKSDSALGESTVQASRGSEWQSGLGKEILPNSSQQEHINLERMIRLGFNAASNRRRYFNSRDANNRGSPVATEYNGYDVGAYVEEDFPNMPFTDVEFRLRRSLEGYSAGINQPQGYAIRGSGASADFAGRGVVVTIVAPTPHRYPGHRPTDEQYTNRVIRSAHIYVETANRTKAPVVVVSPTTVYIFRGSKE